MISLDRILAVIAIIISLSSVIFTYQQMATTIKHNHVSVEPRLYAYFSNEEQKNQFGIYLVNNGLGPAYIEEIKIYLDDEVLPKPEFGFWQSFIKRSNLNPLCFVWRIPGKSTSIKSEEEYFLIRARTAKADECSGDKVIFFEKLKQLKIEIAFESIYGDKFRTIVFDGHL
jgi:hypothetical protein